MSEKSTGVSLDHIYNLRKKFTIIGLTGKTGSGCSEVAKQLVKGFEDGEDFTNPLEFFQKFRGKSLNNAYRKHRIVYNYAKENFTQYFQIKYKHVITLLLLTHTFEELLKYLDSEELKNEFLRSKLPEPFFFDGNVGINSYKELFDKYAVRLKDIDIDDIKENHNWEKLYNLFFGEDFQKFSDDLHAILGKGNVNKTHQYHKLFQILCNNLRKSGTPFKSVCQNSDNIFTIAIIINRIIKSHRECNGTTHVVINSLKNPMEILFFKQRYSAFYSIAINKEYDVLVRHWNSKFGGIADEEIIEKLMDEEYKGGDDKEFHKQKVSDCLQLADIHIGFFNEDDADTLNFNFIEEKAGDNLKNKNSQSNQIKISPSFKWQDQLLKYISLIDHPGLVTPSPEERCMQLAFTAKLNSGCISRQVGATITDKDFSVKAIGWNNTPSGQVPCSLRNANDLIDNSHDINAFTPYEIMNPQFKKVLASKIDKKAQQNGHQLKGRNLCFCFKSLKNSISEGKNQVHTRSLHAEENAFLQLAKYGSGGIENGILFSTASPCELCSKKSYQLGIKLIYYIDPYPGISMEHIITAGEKPIITRLFSGAIGSAYYRVYQPLMPYKDELSLILGQKIIDKAGKLEAKNIRLKEENKQLKQIIKDNNYRNDKD